MLENSSHCELEKRVRDLEEEIGRLKRKQKALIEDLYGKIGRVEVENDWLKKKLGL